MLKDCPSCTPRGTTPFIADAVRYFAEWGAAGRPAGLCCRLFSTKSSYHEEGTRSLAPKSSASVAKLEGDDDARDAVGGFPAPSLSTHEVRDLYI
jgi:hypothetical protein